MSRQYWTFLFDLLNVNQSKEESNHSLTRNRKGITKKIERLRLHPCGHQIEKKNFFLCNIPTLNDVGQFLYSRSKVEDSPCKKKDEELTQHCMCVCSCVDSFSFNKNCTKRSDLLDEWRACCIPTFQELV